MPVFPLETPVVANGMPLRLVASPASAGFPSPSGDDLEDEIDPISWVVRHSSSTFWWRVEGDCLWDAGIRDGDLIAVDRSGKRVVKLYGFGRYFLCRHCSGLFHYSKNEGFWDRSLRQRTKHKRRLSGDASLDAYEMPKPKGMWWRTFYRLQRRAQEAENRAADDFITAAGRYLKVG